MNDPQGLDVKNVSVTMRTVANPKTGQAQRVHVVTYNVGDHGPFENQYPPDGFSAPEVKKDIAAMVAHLRDITNPLNTY